MFELLSLAACAAVPASIGLWRGLSAAWRWSRR